MARSDNVERLERALRAVFADPAIEEISASDLLGDYPAVQYVPQEGDFHLDILPSGVHKHRSVEGMEERRRQWEDANFEAYHERREREMRTSR